MANFLMSNCLTWAMLLIPINSLVGVVIVVIFGVLCFSYNHFFHRMKLKRAPGPFPIWPILGSLPLLSKFPYVSLYNLSKKYGDVMELRLGTTNIVVISSPKLAKEVLQTHDLVFATRSENVLATMFSYGRKGLAWAPYGHDWRQMRKLCTLGLFTPKSLHASKKVRNEEISCMVHEIFEHCKDMLIAGTDTTSTTIEWALAELVKNPKIMKKIQDELDDVVGHDRIVDEDDILQLKYLQAVVKETLRFHVTIPLITRECMTNCKVGGYDILAKTPIMINIWAIHRHSSAYDDPWDFNPERFVGSAVDVKGVDFELLPFGSGRRACPGMPLGLMQVQYELARLLHSFTWKLPIGENPPNMDMSEVFGVTLPKVIPLEVIPIARLPLHMYGPL